MEFRASIENIHIVMDEWAPRVTFRGVPLRVESVAHYNVADIIDERNIGSVKGRCDELELAWRIDFFWWIARDGAMYLCAVTNTESAITCSRTKIWRVHQLRARWFSRHELTDAQRAALREFFGGDVNIVADPDPFLNCDEMIEKIAAATHDGELPVIVAPAVWVAQLARLTNLPFAMFEAGGRGERAGDRLVVVRPRSV